MATNPSNFIYFHSHGDIHLFKPEKLAVVKKELPQWLTFLGPLFCIDTQQWGAKQFLIDRHQLHHDALSAIYAAFVGVVRNSFNLFVILAESTLIFSLLVPIWATFSPVLGKTFVAFVQFVSFELWFISTMAKCLCICRYFLHHAHSLTLLSLLAWYLSHQQARDLGIRASPRNHHRRIGLYHM